MNEITALEHRMADAWPAVVDEPLGDWRLRAAGGFTGRANSALTLGDPGVDVATALSTIRDFATQHGIAPTAHVVVGSPVEERLVAHGWAINYEHPGGAESAVLVADVDGGRADGVRDTPWPQWWELTVGGPPTPAQRHVLSSGGRVGFGGVELDGHTVAAVRAAVVRDTLHVARLAVDQQFRRRGLARTAMAAVFAWGHDHGATHCALQVSVDNHGALGLYRGLGFREHHRYRYWVPPTAVGAACEDRTP